jgi:hypothetical protein
MPKRVRETRQFTTAQSKNIDANHELHQQLSTMALLVDKHRPRSLDALSYHPELSDRLRALVKPPARAGTQSRGAAMLTIITKRLQVETFHICLSMDLLVRERRREFRRP